MTAWSYDVRIARSTELARKYPAARQLLNFYSEIAAFQKTVFSEANDLDGLPRHFSALVKVVRNAGTQVLRDFVVPPDLLTAYWEGQALTEPARFFALALLQPFAEAGQLAKVGQVANLRRVVNTPPSLAALCPSCSSRPVAAILRGEGEGAKRSLLCSLCSTEWPFRRVLCPNCGQEDKEQLPVYSAPEFPHVRVDACDVCKTYIKSVDLTRDGHAVPVVDELATVSLNLWAEEHGYTKLEPNLLGL
jgi:FdhE protein